MSTDAIVMNTNATNMDELVLNDPRHSQCFRFVRADYVAAQSCIELVYAFDHGPELIERIVVPGAPLVLAPQRQLALQKALQILHWIAGVSYYKAGVPPRLKIENGGLNRQSEKFLHDVYTHGLAEFAHQNHLDLSARIHFETELTQENTATSLGLKSRALVPIGGGKDSLVSIESLRQSGLDQTLVWVGNSALIEACARRTQLPYINITRQISPYLFELNKRGAFNGHIPVTAINSAILLCAAILLDFNSIIFSNERSADAATLHQDGRAVNHQWSKSFAFEKQFHDLIHAQISTELHYFSLLRPFSELAITKQFAGLRQYHRFFSSCNRNFRILGDKPTERWCGVCPKCHFVFLALAPFLPKPQLVSIFGRNLLDDPQAEIGFDSLLEFHRDKPFECVGEGVESRAAMAVLANRADWREDYFVQRFIRVISTEISPPPSIESLLKPLGEHCIPSYLQSVIDAFV